MTGEVFESVWDPVGLLRACPEIIESTFDRAYYSFTTDLPYHMLWL